MNIENLPRVKIPTYDDGWYLSCSPLITANWNADASDVWTIPVGGGLANLEFFSRYATRSGGRNVCLLSEGTFHQVHGGVATSGRQGFGDLNAEHLAIFGSDFELPTYESEYFGSVRPAARAFLDLSLAKAGRTDPPAGLDWTPPR